MTTPVDARAVLAALAEDNRASIVRLLLERQLSVTELVDLTGLSQSLVSHHLKVLREARLVEARAASTRTYYRLQASTLAELAGRLAGMAERAAAAESSQPG
jgi:DNA-binding transcriptional ArsR family regulator